MSSVSPNPEPDRPCCFNCRHLAWLIGVGQGLRCMNPGNAVNSDLKHVGFAPLVPSRLYVCDLFEQKPKSTADQTSNEKGGH